MSQRISALQKRAGEIYDKMQALAKLAEDDGDRDFTEEEEQIHKDLLAEYKGVLGKIEREKGMEEMKANLAKPMAVPGNEQKAPAALLVEPMVRYAKLRAFKKDDDAYRCGMFIKATMFGNKNALDWCKSNGVVIQRAAGETVGSTGGYLVPTQFEQAIIDLREAYGTFRQAVTPKPMGSDSMTIPRRAGGLTAYWTNENTAVTESNKSWGQVGLTAKKLAALARMSTELAEDAVISIADDLASEMAYAFAVAEDAAGWNGDGSTTYGGITGVRKKFTDQVSGGSSTFAGALDAATGHDTFAEIDATDLANLMAKLPKYAERNANWYCSQPAWAATFQRLIASAGGVTMGELTGGKPTRSYLGYPVIIDQTLPTSLGDLSDLPMIFFGDLSLAVTMGERRGVTIKNSQERYFEYDQIAILGTERVDINVHDVGDTSTAGPIVALIGE